MAEESREESKATVAKSELDADVIAYLSYRAGEYADERIRLREERRHTVRTVALSLFALIGIGAFSYFINLTLENLIQTKFAELNTENQRRMDQAVALIQFMDVTARLRDREIKVSDSEATLVVSLLKRLKDTRFQPKEGAFILHLEIAVDKLWASERYEAIEKIDDLYQDRMVDAPGIVFTMLSHYGIQVVGGSGEVLQSDDSSARFAAYERAARVGHYPELSILWRLLIAFRQNSNAPSLTTDELTHSVAYLDSGDREFLLKQIANFSDPTNWQVMPRPEAVKVASSIAALLEAYPPLAEAVPSFPEPGAVDIEPRQDPRETI